TAGEGEKGKGKREPRACNGFGHVRIRGVMMRKIATLAASLLPLLSVYPSTRLSSQALHVPYQTFTLPNGLQVLLHEDHSVPLVSVNMWYHVGSSDEKPGRTGFAHLFEHIMFMGSQHVHTGAFDRLLEAAGGDNNGSTTEDRTNYYEDAPGNALPLPLWLDSDRMGFLLPEITAEKVDLQRGVVQNERRQSYENRPYGLAEENILQRLYPPDHPYHWPVIGSMADLSAATLDVLANVLAGGRSSRLYKRLVYELQIATDAVAFQDGGRIDGKFELWATARPGHDLTELERVIDEEIGKIAQAGPTPREVERAQNSFEAQFLSRMERVGGFGGKADQLNFYNYFVGTPDYFEKDLDRYRKVTAAEVQQAARRYLADAHRVVLSVV